MKEEIKKYYMVRAVDLIDSLFDMGYFDREVKRKDMRALDELVAFELQSVADSTKRGIEFTRKIRELESKKP